MLGKPSLLAMLLLHLLRLTAVLTHTPEMSDDDAIESLKLPFCRKGHSTVDGYLDNERFLIVFGGKGLNYKESGSRWLNDLWTLTLDTSDLNEIVFHWEQRDDLTSASAAQRWGYGMASNSLGGVMLVGGMDADSLLYLNDSWFWLPSSSRGWVDPTSSAPWLGQPSGPSSRVGMHLVSLPRQEVLVLLGGEVARRGSRDRNEVTCLADVYSLRTSPILASLKSDRVASAVSELAWRRLSDIPGPCLLNSASVNVIINGRDFIFRFGGSHLGGKREFFSSSILLYDLSIDAWQLISPPYSTNPWPPGRDRHAIAFSRKVLRSQSHDTT